MSWDAKKAIDELVRGRDLTNQLKDLLSQSLGDEDLVGSSEDLVIKICSTFANTLSILRNTICGDYNDESEVLDKLRNNNKDNNNNNNMSSNGRKSEDSGESIKSTFSNSNQKDRRGCYKRRKCGESWISDTSTLVDDGHAWRKYGQKQILKANHPRSYYRCTHKTEQGCQATKQVQKIQDDPPKFRTIYIGHHTCKNMHRPSQLILQDSMSGGSSILLSFANENLTGKQDNPFLSPSPSVKQESKEDYIPSEITYNPSSSSAEYLVSPDHLTTFEQPSAQITALSADHQDVLSGVVVDSVDFGDLLEF